MDVTVYVLAGACLACLLITARLYWELRKWSNICKNGRIAIAYKRKVQLQAPLTEWYLWTRKLDAKENGRVVYRNGGVTVAIVRPVTPPGRVRTLLNRRKPKPQAQSKQGSWSIKQDKPS